MLVLTDTGVGTTTSASNDIQEPTVWTICTFLERTVNPGHQIPYLVILSHCHYDHILGLQHLLGELDVGAHPERPNPSLKIVSSSYKPSFVSPWSTLNLHSLCAEKGLIAPRYNVDIWAKDSEQLQYPPIPGAILPMTVLHTPGHTPDSLTWYDHEHRVLFVGDSLYYEETPETIDTTWGREPPEPIIFTVEGNVLDWWNSVEKLLTFVWRHNQGAEHLPRIKLSAGHTTVNADAEACLTAAKIFMARVLRGDVPQLSAPDSQGHSRAHWTDVKPKNEAKLFRNTMSIVAPLAVIEKGRKQLLPIEGSNLC